MRRGRGPRARLTVGVALFCGLAASACIAPGTARTTRLVPPPSGAKLEPGPPAEVYWLRFKTAVIPPRTTGGLGWDDDNGMPDPVAILSVNGKEVLRTTTDDDTLQPAWEEAPRGNFRIGPGDAAKVELVDYDGITSTRIGEGDLVLQPSDAVAGGSATVDLGRGARVVVAVEPARALYGLGFDFKFQDRTCYVTSFFAYGPAARAGLRNGDKIQAVNDQVLAELRTEEVKSLIRGVSPRGHALTLIHEGGTTEIVTVAEGPVYPLFSEHGRMD